jgi:hypothetical protein
MAVSADSSAVSADITAPDSKAEGSWGSMGRG